MKKYISFLMMAVMVLFTACDVETNEEPGGTAVEKAAGFWTVHVNYSVAEDEGNTPTDEANIESWEWDDMFDESAVVSTYNTASNTDTEIWFDDDSFFGVKVKANLNYQDMTFSCEAKENAASYGGEVEIIKAQVIPNGTKTPSGAVADEIVVYAKITNNANTYGLTYFKYTGYRYTGFSSDN